MKTVTIKTKDGDVAVPAIFPVSGLAVHRAFRGLEENGASKLSDREFIVTHVPSGLAIGSDFDKRAQAVQYAKRLAEFYPVTSDDKTLALAIRQRGSGYPAPRDIHKEVTA